MHNIERGEHARYVIFPIFSYPGARCERSRNGRDGASGAATGNVTHAQTSWFVNADAGDLHLLSTASAAINQATFLASVFDDFDGYPSPIGSSPDVGADEFGLLPPSGLRIIGALADISTLNATRR